MSGKLEGKIALVTGGTAVGFEGPQNPRQRRQSRTYRNSGHRGSCAE